MTRRALLGSFGVVALPVAWPAAAAEQDAGCAPGYILGFGTLTPKPAGVWRVNRHLALTFQVPDTMAEARLRELEGAAVEVIVRKVR